MGFHGSGILRIHTEATIECLPDVVRVEIRPTPDFVHGKVAVGLPCPKCPDSRTGGFARKDELNAVLCADELLGGSRHVRERVWN